MTTPDPRWWEPRRATESTALFLSRVLAALGARDLADRALQFEFDDFRCPPRLDDGQNITRLVRAVREWGGQHPERSSARIRAGAVASAAIWGDFDGTRAEADRWLHDTPEGRNMMASIMSGLRRRAGR